MDAVYKAPSRARGCLRRKRNRIMAVVVILSLLVIIILLSVIISERNSSRRLPSYILLPLYSFPEDGAWAPLQKAISDHPNTNFTLVVNPSDGPGSSSYPDLSYITAMQNLSAYGNVRLIGYVRTTWATRDISSVLSDISVYSGWGSYTENSGNTSTIAVNGIFFDEAPHVYTAEAAEYLLTINQAVKTAPGISGNKTVIHNPGTIVDKRLDDPSTDITVVCEDSYKAYRAKKHELNALSDDRSRHSYMIHTLPAMSSRSLTEFVDSLTRHAEALFVTNLDKEFYKSFGSNWQDFVRIVSR